jgi:hypothetical protein
MIKRLFTATLFSFMSIASVAQLDTLTTHIAKISAYYDSAVSVAFDLRFIYDSDTLLSNYLHRENEGTFIMNRNRFYYRMDNTECMQTDSFLITVMEPEQLIMVAPPSPIQSGGIIPLRKKIDSLVNHGFNGYSYTITKTDSVNIIEFTTTDTTVDYRRIAMYYDPESFALIRYEIGFDYHPEEAGVEVDPEDPEGPGIPITGELMKPTDGSPRNMVLRVYFLNYRIAHVGEDLFNEDRYIKAGGNGEWKGVGKYEGFTVSKMYN